MERALGLGIAVLIAADAVVGLRLLHLAWRTHRVPELAFGLSFILLGVVGYPLSIVARGGAGSEGLLAAALTAQNLACLATYVATWKSFRPTDGLAAGFVALMATAFAASLLGDSLAAGAFTLRDGGPWYYLGFWARALAFFWSALEALRYHGMLRRRLVLGLADPVISDRFRLWGIASLAISAAFLVFLAGRLWTPNVASSPVVLSITSVAGVVAGVAIFLAFCPPAAYLRRIETRQPQPSS